MKCSMKYYECIVKKVEQFIIKDTRKIMSIMRTRGAKTEEFMPKFGMTVGEFCVGYILKLKN